MRLLLLLLWCGVLSCTEVLGQSPRGIQFSKSTHAILKGFNGFPSGSVSVLARVRSQSMKGTLLSVWSRDLGRPSLVVSDPASLSILHSKSTRPIRTGLSIVDGKWHDLGIVLSLSSQMLKVYIDGRLAFRTATTNNDLTTFFNGTSSMCFGQSQTCDGGCFQKDSGLSFRLASFSLWSRDLSEKEIGVMFDPIDVEGSDLPSLLLYYDAATPHNSSLLDSSGNRLDADLGGARILTETDPDEKSLIYFNGDSWLSHDSNNQFPTQALSVALWFQNVGSSSTSATLFSYATRDNTEEVVLKRKATSLELSIASRTFPIVAAAADRLWHHYAVVVSQSLVNVYVDGVSLFSNNLPHGPRIGSNGTFVVAQKQDCVGGCFDPDEGAVGFSRGVRLWSTALTQQQIESDIARLASDFIFGQETTDEELYMDLEPSTGGLGKIPDSSLNGNEASLGMPLFVTDCPNNCSIPLGSCNPDGSCSCASGISGEDCSTGCLNDCHHHGTCVEQQCHCFPMWGGAACEIVRDSALRESWNCGIVPESLTKNSFCPVDYSIPSDSVERFESLDSAARAAFSKVRPLCGEGPGIGYEQKLLKGTFCAGVFPMCANQTIFGACQETCKDLKLRCGVSQEFCSVNAFAPVNSSACVAVSKKVTSEPCDCKDCCNGHGNCTKGKCTCDAGYAGESCEIYSCLDASVISPLPEFCDMITYAVPDHVNLTWADEVAAKAFETAEKFCPYSAIGRFEMKSTFCATSHERCVGAGGVGHVIPCRSMCQKYAHSCGIDPELTCFEDFYGDAPHCFDLFETAEFQKRIRTFATTTLECPTHYNCSNGGNCVNGSCVCPPPFTSPNGQHHGWEGVRCTQLRATCANKCNGQGVCAFGKCNCFPGFFGDDCSRISRNSAGDEKLCDRACLAEGRRSEECCLSREAAASEAKAREVSLCGPEYSCNGHGTCLNKTICECDSGYGGVGCSLVTAREGCAYECSGHGMCEESPASFQNNTAKVYKSCLCDPGWVGYGCEQPHPCPNECSGHGTCHNGNCLCQPKSDWTNIDCSEAAPVCDIDFKCTNGGKCVQKLCRCMKGFTGRKCESRDPHTPMCGFNFNCAHDSTIKCHNDTTGVCECGEGFSGVSCDLDLDPLGPTSVGFTGTTRLLVGKFDDSLQQQLESCEPGDDRCLHRKKVLENSMSPLSFGHTFSFSIEAWIKPEGNTAGIVIQKLGEYSIEFQGENQPIKFTDGIESFESEWSGFILDKWYHLAMVVNTTNRVVTGFVDGEAVGSQAVASSRQFEGAKVRIGGNQSSGFVGRIADVRIWEEARSTTNIRWNMHRRVRLPAKHLVGYWRFQNTTTLTHDSTNRSPNAEMLGNVLWQPTGPVLIGKTPVHSPAPENREFSRLRCSEFCSAGDSECSWYSGNFQALSSGVCVSSKVAVGQTCASGTFENARRTCREMGARLCSVEEFETGKATTAESSRNCGYEDLASQLVWTGSVCQGVDPSGLFDGMFAISANEGSIEQNGANCQPLETELSFRCCADTTKPDAVSFEKLPSSCREAKWKGGRGINGKTESGGFAIRPEGSEDAVQVYCNQGTAGGGWLLVANQAPKLPTAPQQILTFRNPINASNSFMEESYNALKWSHDLTYFRPYADILETAEEILLLAGDKSRWCVLRSKDVGSVANILDSFGTRGRAYHTTPTSVNGSIAIGCEGTQQENQGNVLWGRGSDQTATNLRGVGLFVSSGFLPPTPTPTPSYVDSYDVRYDRVLFSNQQKCETVELGTFSYNGAQLIATPIGNVSTFGPAGVDTKQISRDTFSVCRRADDKITRGFNWLAWKGIAPRVEYNNQILDGSTAITDETEQQQQQGLARCERVKFSKNFGYKPLVQCLSVGNSSTASRIWLTDVDKRGASICAESTTKQSKLSKVHISLLAYDHTPGPGGKSGFEYVPLPEPNTGSTICMNLSLPYRYTTKPSIFLTLTTESARENTNGGGSAWLLSTSRLRFTVCVDNPTFSNLSVSWLAFGTRDISGETADENSGKDTNSGHVTATTAKGSRSCWEAKSKRQGNRNGVVGSGAYRLQIDDPELSDDFQDFYCDMDVLDGSGWLLVGNVKPGIGFLPDSIGHGPEALSSGASVNSGRYSPTFWNHNASYWIRHAGVEEPSKVLFMTGDRQIFCSVRLSDVRQWLPIGNPPNATVLASQGTKRQAGEMTAITNEPIKNGGRILIGCNGEFPDNLEGVLFAHNARPHWQCLSDSHGGVGVFVQ